MNYTLNGRSQQCIKQIKLWADCHWASQLNASSMPASLPVFCFLCVTLTWTFRGMHRNALCLKAFKCDMQNCFHKHTEFCFFLACHIKCLLLEVIYSKGEKISFFLPHATPDFFYHTHTMPFWRKMNLFARHMHLIFPDIFQSVLILSW